MLAAENRLRESDAFRRTVRTGRRAGSAALVVHVASGVASGAGLSDRPARIGFVVGRAVGGAVVRNRVRRRLRHQVRALVVLLPAGTVVVVRALPASATMSGQELGQMLVRCLERVAPAVRGTPATADDLEGSLR